MKEELYIGSSLQRPERIEDVRRRLLQTTQLYAGEYREVEPHLTIVPRVIIRKEEIPVVRELVRNASLAGTSIRCKQVSVRPGLDNPRVVYLDCECDNKIREIRNECYNLGRKMDRDSKEHITLLRMPSSVSWNARRKMGKVIGRDVSLTVRIKDVYSEITSGDRELI